MGWWSQLAACLSGESAENQRAREEAREAFDRYDAQQRAAEHNRRQDAVERERQK
jgi:hypothetical protein